MDDDEIYLPVPHPTIRYKCPLCSKETLTPYEETGLDTLFAPDEGLIKFLDDPSVIYRVCWDCCFSYRKWRSTRIFHEKEEKPKEKVTIVYIRE